MGGREGGWEVGWVVDNPRLTTRHPYLPTTSTPPLGYPPPHHHAHTSITTLITTVTSPRYPPQHAAQGWGRWGVGDWVGVCPKLTQEGNKGKDAYLADRGGGVLGGWGRSLH